MDTPQPRRRAPGMNPEQRREMVLQAALPLVAEFGAAVTTQQIARAAGIGDATVFRVFTDKEELLQACVERALDPSAVLQELRSISLDQPLTGRLIEAAEALDGYLNRMGTVIGSLHATGRRHRRPPHDRDPVGDGLPARSAGRDTSQAATREAITELFEPDRARLRLPLDTVTALFTTLLLTRGRLTGDDQPRPDIQEIVDVFLNGAVTQPESV